MKIKPEVLRSFKGCYHLRDAITAAKCTQEDKAEICEYILGDDELFSTIIPHLAALQDFIALFAGINPEIENKIYQKLFAREQHATDYFSNYYNFKHFYALFVHKDLSLEVKSRRCAEILNLLVHAPAFEWLNRGDYLAELVISNPDLQDQVVRWAENNFVLHTEKDRARLMESIDRLKKSAEEEARKEELAATLKMMRGKIAQRNNSLFVNAPVSASTPLHNLAKSIWQNKDEVQRAIALIKGGASLEARDQFGDTPLATAALEGNFAMTLLLFSYGARANVVDRDGYMPEYYKQFYSCDHEFDDGGCIPLKRFMDNPMRNLLSKVADLEKTHLTDGVNLYSLEKIKPALLAMMRDDDFQNAKPLAALCGYIFNHVAREEQQAVCQLFLDNCKQDLSQEQDLQSSYAHVYASLKKPVSHSQVSTMSAYRDQMYGNKVSDEVLNSSSIASLIRSKLSMA